MYSDKLFFVSNHMHFSKTQRDHIPFKVEFKVTDLYISQEHFLIFFVPNQNV